MLGQPQGAAGVAARGSVAGVGLAAAGWLGGWQRANLRGGGPLTSSPASVASLVFTSASGSGGPRCTEVDSSSEDKGRVFRNYKILLTDVRDGTLTLATGK